MTVFTFAAWQRALREASRRRIITASAAHTALWLESFADHGTGDNARPSVGTIAAIQQVTEDTIRRNLVALRKSGFIVQAAGGSRYGPATYAMSVPNFGDESPQSDDDNSGVASPVLVNSGVNFGDNSGADKGTTSLTSLTSITYDTYAANLRLAHDGATDAVVYRDLVAGLSEAIAGEYVSLPYASAETYEEQAVLVLADVLPALAEDGIDIPLLYLRAILQRDGEFQFGLAVREKWLLLVGKEAS